MSDRVTPEKLAEWRRMLEYTTRAPWGARRHRVYAANAAGEPEITGMRVGDFPHVANVSRPDDADFMAMARSAVPALLDENERLREALQRLVYVAENHEPDAQDVAVARRALGEEQ